jgi:HAD superfamily hydrolase (TIGR01509 family)
VWVVGIVLGVHQDGLARPAPQRPSGVLFDFHGTLAQVEDAVAWVLAAAADRGRDLDRAAATVLADRLVTAGRAGGPKPDRVPPQLAEVYADRDLYEYAFRAAYTGLLETVPTDIDGLADALFARVLLAEGWVAYEHSVAVLAELRARDVPVAVVSNIGFDIRPVTEALGFHKYVDAYVLSYELGRCKPDPAVFRAACDLIGVEPERVLVVGDTPADAAANAIGCRAYVLPTAPPGTDNGLADVLPLVRA